MTNESYVFDSYALIEIINGNPQYERYTSATLVINDFIFAEICYYLMRIQYPNASHSCDQYANYLSRVDAKSIKAAMQFRHEHKKKKLSMTDCVSYCMAKELGIKFLTGDKQFKHLPNVEFVA